MTVSRPSGRCTVWLLTAAATCLGAGLGWYLASVASGDSGATADPLYGGGAAIETSIETSGAATDRAGDGIAGMLASSPVDTAVGWFRADRLGGAAARPLGADAWPVILYRAGDGGFYADLSLDGHIVNSRIDPGREHSVLHRSDLPSGAAPAGSQWQVQDVVFEHLRLPAAAFRLTDEPATESVIGADLLARFFSVEEQFDRMRLVPRAD